MSSLHDFWFEQRKARKAAVARSQVIDCNAKSERARLGNPIADILDPIERRSLRDLQHHPAGQGGPVRIDAQISAGIEQFLRMEIDEQRTLRRRIG